MALLTTAQEYQKVREAIQALTTTSKSLVTVQFDGVSTTYENSVATRKSLMDYQVVLANQICNRNRRKRTSPDFSYDA